MAETETVATEPSLMAQYTVTQDHYRTASNRLAALTAKAGTGILTDEEELEQLQLERRMSNLQPVLERLELEVMREQREVDIQAVLDAWDAGREAKRQDYATL